MVDVRSLLKYNESVRHRYFESLTKLPWKEFTKNREASFHSIRNIFIHTLGATDYWLDFLLKESLHSRKGFNEYRSYKDIGAYVEHVEKRIKKYFDSLSLQGLNKTYKVKCNGDTIEVTAEDVLIHASKRKFTTEAS